MAVSRAMRRLLRVLELEEQQAHGALELALAELRRLEQAYSLAVERARAGRRLVAASAGSGELMDRLAGLEEICAARRMSEVLQTRLAEMEKEAAARREVFLAKRAERRQAETVIAEAEARDAAEAGRRAQQSTDEWFLDRKRRVETAEGAASCLESCERVGASEEA